MMTISLFSSGIRTNSKCAVFRVRNTVIKLPLTVVACKRLHREKLFFDTLKSDEHFSPYVPEYWYFGCAQCMPYATPLSVDQHAKKKIKEYFKIAFHNSNEWQDVKLKDLVEYEHFMSFVFKYLPKEYLFWENYFHSAKMPQSSAHGDFHAGNVLSENDKLLFIDWTNFRTRSSRYFDLFNYDIFSQREKNTSWVEKWHKEYIEHKKSSIQEIEISRSHVIGFAIWRVSAEIEILTARQKLTPQKIRKYKDLVISLPLLSRTC